MLSVMVVAANDSRLAEMQSLIRTVDGVRVLRSYNRYPDLPQLLRFVSVAGLDLLLLDFAEPGTAHNVALHVHRTAPRVALVAFQTGKKEMPDAAVTGIVHSFEGFPEQAELNQVMQSAMHAARGGVLDNLVVFIPAKAGSGASILSLNIARALAGTLHRPTLLMEGDIRSGVLSFLLDQNPASTIQDLLDAPAPPDAFAWQRSIVNHLGIDFLFSGRRATRRRPAWNDYFAILDYARSRYDHILVDLPEVTNDATAEFIRRAKSIYVVTTPEAPFVKLAYVRLRELCAYGATEDRVSLVINRWHKKDTLPNSIEALLKQRVVFRFPNDYAAIQQAFAQATALSAESPLGRSCVDFARMLNGEVAVPVMSAAEGDDEDWR